MSKKVKINPRKIWQLPKGHSQHQSGSGEHDNRPKRLRTRQAKNTQAMRDYE
jgi:hypothetical protein